MGWLVCLFLLAASLAPAPIVRPFPGADRTIQESREILVVQIFDGEAEHSPKHPPRILFEYDPTNGTFSGDFDEQTRSTVKILYTIKGEDTAGTTRSMPITFSGKYGQAGSRLFVRGSVHIVFSRRSGDLYPTSWFVLDRGTSLLMDPALSECEKIDLLLERSAEQVRRNLEIQQAQLNLWRRD